MRTNCCKSLLLFLLIAINISVFSQDFKYPFQNPNFPIDYRVKDLVSRLTLEEKVDQLMYNAKAIPRLDIPEYNWWSECLHGVARNGRATVFPQAIGMAATFDTGLIYRIGAAIADEGRAKFNACSAKGYRGIYQGLTFWTPNVNLFRDPRWGRGQETYGEDPFLISRIGVAFVKGLQGDHPKYLKAAGCAKHYAVHSGPEGQRHEFDALLFVWYPGEQGGQAIADVIFGDAVPSGHLPVTFPRSLKDLPAYEDYSMIGRTYRYMEKKPLFPFGFGLSYTTFKYNDLKLSAKEVEKGKSVIAEVTITNTGKVKAEEIVQLYITDLKASTRVPFYSLKGFQRVTLTPGENKKVTFEITPKLMQMVDDEGKRVIEKGEFKIIIGSACPAQRSVDLGAAQPVETVLLIK